MALSQPILLTVDDYRAMPETGPRYQLVYFPGLKLRVRDIFRE